MEYHDMIIYIKEDFYNEEVYDMANHRLSDLNGYMKNTPIYPNMKNENAYFISKNYSSLRGVANALVNSGCDALDNFWWNPDGVGFKANIHLPPVIALEDITDVSKFSKELAIHNRFTKIEFVGMVGLRFRDLSYNDDAFNIQSLDDYNENRYTMYVFSYGASHNTFGLRVGAQKFNKNIVDIMISPVNISNESSLEISNELSDFIKECRDRVNGV